MTELSSEYLVNKWTPILVESKIPSKSHTQAARELEEWARGVQVDAEPFDTRDWGKAAYTKVEFRGILAKWRST